VLAVAILAARVVIIIIRLDDRACFKVYFYAITTTGNIAVHVMPACQEMTRISPIKTTTPQICA
jgi:hypothetical protein